MQNIRKKGILYTSSGATRKFQTAGKIEDPTLSGGTFAGNALRKASGYGKNILKNSKTWGDGSRINARKAKRQFDADSSTSLGQKANATSAKLTGDYGGGYFKNQGTDVKAPSLEANSFTPKPSDMLSASNYTLNDGKMTNNQPGVTSVAANSGIQKGVDAIGAVGAAGQSLSTPVPTSGGFNANAGIYSAAGNMAGSALQSIDDKKEYNYSTSEKVGTVGGDTLKGAAMGASVGAMFGGVGAVPGAVIGAAAGVVKGLITSSKKGKSAKKALAAKTTHETNVADKMKMNDLLTQEQNLSVAPVSTGYTAPPASGYGQTIRRKAGGTFSPIKFKESTAPNRIVKKKAADVLSPKKFKRGGSIKPTENIIPAGVLHEEDNEIGDKGMPVVKCKNNSCEKKYEIEKDEMIFTLTATKQTEELVGKKDYSKLGKFVKAQILDNTHSFTEKYNELNNM